MRIFRTLRTRRPSYSTAERTLRLTSPTSWGEMTQEQLRYVLHLLATMDGDLVRIKTYMLCRFTGLEIGRSAYRPMDGRIRKVFVCHYRTAWWRPASRFFLSAETVQGMIHQFDFIDQYDGMDVRLDTISGYRAVDDELHEYPFRDYLTAETYYQLSLSEEDIRKKAEYVEKLAVCLYRDYYGKAPSHIRLSAVEQLGTMMWFAHVKAVLAEEFPNFFRRTEGADAGDYDIISSRNAQIRALTEGDITKEALVLDMDCWRALAELDQKAREAREFKEKYGNK